MDSLFNLYGIAACVIFAFSVPVLIVAAFMPKQQRSKILHMVLRWFGGL
jgi:hypothetical protein